MERRTACQAIAALYLPSTPWLGAQTTRVARVAYVTFDSPGPDTPFLSSFRNGMKSFGWTEGRNLNLEVWKAAASTEMLKTFIPKIDAANPDVIVAAGGGAIRPLIDAQLRQPVVFAFSADAVLGKIVQSWARPGVNRTGVSFFALDLIPKRMELMREAFPYMQRLAIVGWPPHAGEHLEIAAASSAADRLGLRHEYFGANTGSELDAAFESITRWKADALLVFAGTIATAFPERFAAYGMRQRIPTASAWGVFAERGNLMTYGPVLKDSYFRLASFVDRILRGAKAENLPVELPTTFELVLNLKTARSIGIEIPQSVLVRADRLIE